MKNLSVEKIGGTSMSNYAAIRDNIILKPSKDNSLYGRIFVVSAYGGITNKLLEHKKNSLPGIYALFANSSNDETWKVALQELEQEIFSLNQTLFGDGDLCQKANDFIGGRLTEAKACLQDLQSVCQHGHFSLDAHLSTVREMLASIGEAHSAWNTAHLLQCDDINAVFVDLTGWNNKNYSSLDDCIQSSLADIDYENTLPIVTGYAHCKGGLMSIFDRGYSEMTFSRLAVLSDAREAIIHKEFHLSSADPSLVGDHNAVPIGRTNYDVADQLANLGMEAIHPRAAKGLRQSNIPLRVKNTFEPEHPGTLITVDYKSEKPRVEIIAGDTGFYAIEVFSQDMAGNLELYDQEILTVIRRFKARIVSKDVNANTVTHYLDSNLKTVKRIVKELQKRYEEAEVDQRKVAILSAIGSDLKIPGMLAKTVKALSDSGINVLAMHQSMRQVDMQFVVNESDYEEGIRSLHRCLVESHDHGVAICLAS